jgi:hypothetical protein
VIPDEPVGWPVAHDEGELIAIAGVREEQQRLEGHVQRREAASLKVACAVHPRDRRSPRADNTPDGVGVEV